MEFRSIHSIETADNIHLKVELAGLASRVFAFGIDAIFMLILMGLVFAVFSALSLAQSSPEIAKTGVPLGLFIVFFGYHLFQEWWWNGKTIGKSIFNIRVVRDNGQPIGFWEAVGRNLLRILDVYLSGIGLLCMMFNRSEKRFGDFISGTIVVNDQPIAKPGKPVAKPNERIEPDELQTVAIRITPEETELLQAYRARRKGFLAEPKNVLSQALCRYFSERWHIPVESEADLDSHLDAYLQHVQKSEPA